MVMLTLKGIYETLVFSETDCTMNLAIQKTRILTPSAPAVYKLLLFEGFSTILA